MTLSSRDNRWLKQFRLALRGEALEGDLVGVEGLHLVEEALRSGREVPAVLVSASGEPHLAGLQPWLGPAVQLLHTSDRLFAGVAETRSPQGIAALVRARPARFEDVVAGSALVVVLGGVQDPGNVGTVIRSAEAFGASGIITAPGTAHPLGPKALRASAGSALRLPLFPGAALPVLLVQLRMAGLRLCAASTQAGIPPADADFRGPVAVLIGGEGAGLPAEVERSVDLLVRIPVAPPVDSLNAAIAASILLYEAARQRAAEAKNR